MINKQKQSKRKTKVPNKKQVSHSAVDVDENQSIDPNSDSTETSTEESNKLEEDNAEEDIFDSVEHLWDENRQLKSSFKILDGSLVTITQTLSDIRSQIDKQDEMITQKLNKIEIRLDSKISLFSEEIHKSINQKFKDVRKEMNEKLSKITSQYQSHVDEKLKSFSLNMPEQESDPITNFKIIEDKLNSINDLKKTTSDLEKSVESNFDHMKDMKIDFNSQFQNINEQLRELETKDCDLLRRIVNIYNETTLKEENEKEIARIQSDLLALQTKFSNIELVINSKECQKKTPIQDRLLDIANTPANLSKSFKEGNGLKCKDDSLLEDHQPKDTVSILLAMDSNRRYLQENRLSPDMTKKVKITPCGNLDDLEILSNNLDKDLQVLYIHTGVNDVELFSAERVHDEYCSIISKIKSNHPQLQIVLSEITPRFDLLDNQVLRLNALLFQTYRNDRSVYIVRNNNLRKQSFYSDNKHINRESINLLAGNIKHGLRKVLGIKLDKSRKAESKPPLSNQQNTTCNKELSNTAGTFAAFLHSIFQDFQGFQK